MPTTDTSERGLESLIVAALTGTPASTVNGVHETAAPYGGACYVAGDPHDYDRAHCLDFAKLLPFLRATQPKTVELLQLEQDGPSRAAFLARLQGEVAKRGTIDLLRKGLKHGPASVDLFYGTPTPGNAKAADLHAANLFSVSRQLRYSADQKALALDLALFVNGLPVATFELKNHFTGQTVADAVQQYKRDRDPREPLFAFGRCLVHFAVDDAEVLFCTWLRGPESEFLPFNKGYNDGAGNPPNPDGIKTAYLWRDTLSPAGITEIIENYAQRLEQRNPRTDKIERKQIFPRYHQIDCVRRLLADARQHGAGRRYLIQHSAGSGKSNSIAWLAHQLIGVQRAGKRVFDTVVVVTDRRVLDKQIQDTIKQFAQVKATVGHADSSAELKQMIAGGKAIVISTVQKFPVIVDSIGNEHQGRRFAIVIDEAHSSQGGRVSATMNVALSGEQDDEDETTEDAINRLMEAKKMLPNASYFAFTATPKNKTLEIFGEPADDGGASTHRPFHSYTMKQAIQEGFILDVLRSYTPVNSYYQLEKRVEDDPEFDKKRAQSKLRRYVEGHEHAIRAKAEIMVDHFLEQVIGRRKIGGQARGMVVCNGIRRAIDYYVAIRAYLKELGSPYQAIVAFSGEHDYGGAKVTEASLNGFPSSQIVEKIREEPYRLLICADKFQTGYDEPLLHTMYVDKPLSSIKAVQTLSRLNRARPGKIDTFVLDFQNDEETIQAAFAPYYRTTLLAGETDPNKLHNLKADLDAAEVYDDAIIETVVARYLGGEPRELWEPLLDGCVGTYTTDLDGEAQIAFKGKAKAFLRGYGFLSAVLPYSNASWEKLSILLTFLVPKLPAPAEDDPTAGILDAIDMDSYRVEKRQALRIALDDVEGQIGPVPTGDAGHLPEPEIDTLSNILHQFNDQFGNIDWSDADKIQRALTELPAKVASDKSYQNAMHNADLQNARIEHDKALDRAMTGMVNDHTQLFKLYSDDESFRKWLKEMTFAATYAPPR